MTPRRQPMYGPDVAPQAAAAPMQFAPMALPQQPGGLNNQVMQGLARLATAMQSGLSTTSALQSKVVDSPLNRPRQPFPNPQQAGQLDALV